MKRTRDMTSGEQWVTDACVHQPERDWDMPGHSELEEGSVVYRDADPAEELYQEDVPFLGNASSLHGRDPVEASIVEESKDVYQRVDDAVEMEQPMDCHHCGTEEGTRTLCLWTCNIGGWWHVMSEEGTPSGQFVACLATLTHPFVAGLNDLRLKPDEGKWKVFAARIPQIIKGCKVGRLRGSRRGVAVIHSAMLTKVSYPDQEPVDENDTLPEEDFVELHIRGWDTHNPDARLILLFVYFPFARENASGARRAIVAARKETAVEGCMVVMVGDMNLERQNKSYYGRQMIMAALVRVQTPTTGKSADPEKGGRAQAIWTTHPHLVREVRVWREVSSVSDHHHPVSCTVPLLIRSGKWKEARVRDKMRLVLDAAKYQVAINAVQRGPEAAVRLKSVMREHTAPPQRAPPLYRQKVPRVQSELSAAEFRKRAAQTRARISRRIEKHDKKLVGIVCRNDPLLRAMIRPAARPTCIPSRTANQDFAEALMRYSWKKEHCDVASYFSGFASEFRAVHPKLVEALTAEFDVMELQRCLKSFSQRKTYADYEGKVVHLMGPSALLVLSDDYNERRHRVDKLVRVYLGIPSGKINNEKEYLRRVLKSWRAIGIGEVLDAFYFHCQNQRLMPIIQTVSPKSMMGFIPHREGHDMILQILFAVELANRKRMPFWCVQADMEKHFDRLQHEAIEALDKLLGIAEPFFTEIVDQIRRQIAEVRVVQGKPGIATQNSGGPQGDQRLPTLSTLLLAPLVYELERHAAASLPSGVEDEIKRLIRFICNFADDFLFCSHSLEDAFGRFLHAQKMAAQLSMTLSLVAIAGSEATKFHGPYTWTHLGKNVEIQGSLKILGACIHFQRGSPCAKRKCQTCDHIGEGKFCCECQHEAIDKIAGLGLPTLDRAEIANSRFLSSARYGVYTYHARREAWFDYGKKIRHVLGGHGYGGYVEAATLSAKYGGVGIQCSAECLAVEVAGVVERALNRNEKLQALARALMNDGGDWPDPLQKALRTTDGPRCPVEVQIHPRLLRNGDERRSQDVPVVIEVKELGGNENMASILVIARPNNGVPRYYHVFEMRQGVQKKWNSAMVVSAQVRLLARLIEEEALSSRRVTLKRNLPGALAAVVEAHRVDHGRIFREGRAYVSVLARTEVNDLSNDDFDPPGSVPDPVETNYKIPELYPLSVKHNGDTFIEGAIAEPMKRVLLGYEIKRYRERRQIADVLPIDVEIDHEASACAAGILRGAHYDTRLSTGEAEIILGLRTGALIKTPNTEQRLDWPGITAGVEQEMTTVIKSGKRCQAVLRSGDMTRTCGEPLTLPHVLSHVSEDDLMAATIKINRESKIGEMKIQWGIFTTNHPKYLALGFIPPELYKTVPPNMEKAKRKQLALTATTYARLGIECYKRCAGTVTSTIPEFLMEKAEDIARQHKYIAKADAALKEEKGGGITAGLGGYIALAADPQTIVHSFKLRRRIPILNSGLAEHLSNLVLKKMVLMLGLGDVCFGSDNNSVPNQHEGNWIVNSPFVRLVRARTAEVACKIVNYHDVWFPREENTIADRLSKEALLCVRDMCDPGWVVELDEVLREMEGLLTESADSLMKELQQ